MPSSRETRSSEKHLREDASKATLVTENNFRNVEPRGNVKHAGPLRILISGHTTIGDSHSAALEGLAFLGPKVGLHMTRIHSGNTHVVSEKGSGYIWTRDRGNYAHISKSVIVDRAVLHIGREYLI